MSQTTTTSNQLPVSDPQSNATFIPSETVSPQSQTPPNQLPQAPPPYSESVDGSNERTASTSSDVPPYSEISPQTRQFSEQPAPILPAGVQGMDILPSTGRTSTLTGAQLTGMITNVFIKFPLIVNCLKPIPLF